MSLSDPNGMIVLFIYLFFVFCIFLIWEIMMYLIELDNIEMELLASAMTFSKQVKPDRSGRFSFFFFCCFLSSFLSVSILSSVVR